MLIIAYIIQNSYINNNLIIIGVSQRNAYLIDTVNNNSYEWDQSSGKPNTVV